MSVSSIYCETLMLMLMQMLTPAATACPVECSCNSTSKHVYCHDPSMVGIPASIPADTVSLTIVGTATARLQKVTHLKKSDLAKLTDLRDLFIFFTELSMVDEDVFQGMTSLTQVYLMENKLQRIPKGLFQNLPSLNNIDLSGNNHCILELGCFSGLSSLQYLYLGHMDLGVLETAVFEDLSFLEGLFIEGNNLESLNKNILLPLKRLEALDISNNKLTMLPEDLKSTLSNVQTLNLNDNPWHCNCEVEWMKGLPTVSKAKYGSDTMVLCIGPPALKFQNLMSIASEDLVCIPPKIDCGGPFVVEFRSPLNIECEVEGDPVPTLVFTSPSGVTIKRNALLNGYKLYSNLTLIKQASESDGGDWRVTATNKEKSDNQVFHINVLNIPTTSTSSTKPAITSEPMSLPAGTRISSHVSEATPRGDRIDERVTGAKGKDEDDLLGVILGCAFGGLTILAVATIAITSLYKKFNKNTVKPLKTNQDDIFHGRHLVRSLPPISTAWV